MAQEPLVIIRAGGVELGLGNDPAVESEGVIPGLEVAFPDHRRGVADPSQLFPEAHLSLSGGIPVCPNPMAVGIPAGKDSVPGRTVEGILDIAVIEDHTTAGKSIDMRCFSYFTSVTPQGVRALLIGEKKKNARFSYGHPYTITTIMS